MEWDLGIIRASYESLLLSYGVWEFLLPYIIWGQRIAFLSVLLVSTVGRRLRLRRKYVELLDRLFQFAAAKLTDEQCLEEEEEGEEEADDGVVICPESPHAAGFSDHDSRSFQLDDSLGYLAAGMRAVVQDCVSKSFTSAELRTWNMLSRTQHKRYLRMSPSLTSFWLLGVIIRYFFLLPMRALVIIISLSTLVILCSLVGLLPESDFKRRLNARVVMWCFDFVAGSISVVARFHNKEYRPTHGIAVANHTSPIDSMVLATDQCYDMVGQKTQGILGVFMSALSKSSSHIWFDRTEAKERASVTQRLQDHAQNTDLPPILIFPEGACVNNTTVLQFKKGAFELDATIYPIAIRFDPRYGDAFWWQDTFIEYAVSMMTSWAIVADIWYLPPVKRRPGETAMAFAHRVKALIAHRGGFVELAWDGFIKLNTGKVDVWERKQAQWRQKQQQEYARHLSHTGTQEGEEETQEGEEERGEMEKSDEREMGKKDEGEMGKTEEGEGEGTVRTQEGAMGKREGVGRGEEIGRRTGKGVGGEEETKEEIERRAEEEERGAELKQTEAEMEDRDAKLRKREAEMGNTEELERELNKINTLEVNKNRRGETAT